jgi:adenosine deaminase
MLRRTCIVALSVLLGCGGDPVDADAEAATAAVGPKGWCTRWPNDKPPASVKKACQREAAVDAALGLVGSDAAALEAWLAPMPKGADLHSHLSGAVETEELVSWAVSDGICVDAGRATVPCATPGSVKAASVPAAELVRAWSMEGFVGDVKAGHDHFFATFMRFRLAVAGRMGEALAAVSARAAEDRVSYLELMAALGASTAGKLAEAHMDAGASWTDALLAAEHAELRADPKLAKNVAKARVTIDEMMQGRAAALGCGGASPAAGCGVEVRFIVQVAREASRESVFGQLVHAFELGAVDDRVVGVNLAMAEDGPLALAGYEDHMRALDFLHAHYGTDRVHVALHAGELVPELLPPGAEAHLGFHILRAVEVGHAERIGHGVDVLGEVEGETSSEQLRARMRELGVLVEVCLTSNDAILGVRGDEHPLAAYRASGVPLALATDDAGVLRTSLGEELGRAVREHGLGWTALKAMARRSIEHAFVGGESLWGASEGDAVTVRADCRKSSAKCKALRAKSRRASLAWDLEEALVAFEKSVLAP